MLCKKKISDVYRLLKFNSDMKIIFLIPRCTLFNSNPKIRIHFEDTLYPMVCLKESDGSSCRL